MLLCCTAMGSAQQLGSRMAWDGCSLIENGKRIMPVMGEMHYSRLPQTEWATALQRMKDGGITVVATYVFWNHVEEVEGKFDWTGQRDLRRFLLACRDANLAVVLRIGPYCHGEARCGGIPDWVLTKGCRVRSEDARFLQLVETFYRQIFRQVEGLQWKDGGPVLACQFDNEFRGDGAYLMALKRMATDIGFDLPFYTRTGWPELRRPVPHGEMLPLYGDYADGFWDRGTEEGCGDYWQAFHFKASPTAAEYPYFTCELGGGMMTSYHRRVWLYPEDAYAMAVVKLGSGSNLLGYYMYHGGTNPEGRLTTLNEHQRTPATNHNDLPVKTYDFQAPLGEFGQRRPHYFMLRLLHLFCRDFGSVLAPMKPVFTDGEATLQRGDGNGLRHIVRTDGTRAFVFVNNYARFEQLGDKHGVQFEACGTTFPQSPTTIPAGCSAIFPVNITIGKTTIDYATAQVVAQRDGCIYLMQIDGIPTELKVNGRVMRNVQPRGIGRPVCKHVYLLTRKDAEHFLLPEEAATTRTPLTFHKRCEARPARTITIGVQKVAEEPTDDDFLHAAVYDIDLPAVRSGLLHIDYQGDCARLYALTANADGTTTSHFIDDNFYNGRTFDYGLWRLPANTVGLELRVLPIQPDMPVYFPREADTTPGERVLDISVEQTAATDAQPRAIDLAGTWAFTTGDTPSYKDFIRLPGSMLTNGKGDDVTARTQWTASVYDSSYYFNPAMEPYRRDPVKYPFFLTPDKHYVGRAWYRRSVYVPADLQGQRIVLFLERPHIETTAYVNGKQIGHQMSLSTPHEYDVTDAVNFGAQNDIEICVYNGIENVGVGQDSHSVTDQTQGNWNGITGRMELQVRPRQLSIRHVRVVPDVENRLATVEVKLDIPDDARRRAARHRPYAHATAVPVNGFRPTAVQSERVEIADSQLVLTLRFGDDMQTWDEFNPVVYRLTVNAGDDVYETQFGMRNISIDGAQLLLNGQPIWLRGTVENCCFPLTGYPPTDEEEWVRIFRTCREWGINHVRFHSYCPPEAAFAAADLVGIYLQPEGPTWPNHGVRLRRGMNIDQYLMEESRRIVDTYGNHPSFLMMAAGNEPAGDWVAYCNDWVAAMQQYDDRRIYCGASVGGGWAWDDGSQYHVKGGARGLDWDKAAPQSADDYTQQILFPRNYKGTEPNRSPIVAHEQGQWCVFPDLKEVNQYTGVYHARNFDIFADLLARHGMAQQADRFLKASGRLQSLCYKFEIERNLRTPDYAGFQLLGLNDYSGQGTALVGPLNVFWREKGYIDAQEWREFCSPLVLLARFPKFVYANTDTLHIGVEAYHAGNRPLAAAPTTFAILTSAGDTLASDILSTASLPQGKNIPVGNIHYPLSAVSEPMQLTLHLNAGTTAHNHYDFWVYPSAPPVTDERGIHITDTLDTAALNVLRKGGRVLLLAAGKVTYGSDIRQTYLPVFWNTSWFKMRPPHTTGATIDTTHALFRHFPTDDWANLQWWELLNRAQVMNLDLLPADYQSPVQPIDTWHVSRKLGMIVEANVLSGRLLMTTFDLTRDLPHRLVARQMRHAILTYMQSDSFRPTLTLSPSQLHAFFTEQAPPIQMFTNESPDELKPQLAP